MSRCRVTRSLRRGDCEQRDFVVVVAADRHDDAALNKPIEEPGMLIPAWLLTAPPARATSLVPLQW